MIAPPRKDLLEAVSRGALFLAREATEPHVGVNIPLLKDVLDAINLAVAQERARCAQQAEALVAAIRKE